MLHPAANRHPKATHRWLLMGVQACRLPALKHLKPLKTLKTLATRHRGPSLPFAMLQPPSNRHPKATHQWLLMGVQACPLPVLKRLKPLKTLHRLKTLKRLKALTTRHGGPSPRHPKATHQWLLMGVQACRFPALKPPSWGSKPAVCHASSCSQQAPQGHTSMASYGRPSLPFASP